MDRKYPLPEFKNKPHSVHAILNAQHKINLSGKKLFFTKV